MTPRGRPGAGGPDRRAAIVEAARGLFADRGYDRTTIRAIAEHARVDPALVYHYFDDKQAVLIAALTPPVDTAKAFASTTDDPGQAGRQLVSRVLHAWDSDPRIRAHLSATLRTALSHKEAAAVVRDNQRALALAAVGELVREDDYELRLALIGAQLAGVLLARYLIESPALAAATTDQLVDVVGPLIQHLITEPLTVESRISR